MTTFGQDMAQLAQELTLEFSEETGISYLIHYTGNVYDPVTGTHVPTTVQETAYMVFEDIESDEVQDISYLAKHRQCTIAGDDLTVAPVRDDIIVTPDAVNHRIVDVKTDQYTAAYILHIERDGTQ